MSVCGLAVLLLLMVMVEEANPAPVPFIIEHKNIVMTLHGLIDHADVPAVLVRLAVCFCLAWFGLVWFCVRVCVCACACVCVCVGVCCFGCFALLPVFLC